MPIIETEIFGSKIEINYKKEEKEKLVILIDNFKNRLSEFSDLQGKVTDNKILFLAALKAEDSNYDLKEKLNFEIKEKQVSLLNNSKLDDKIKEIIILKDSIIELKKRNQNLEDINKRAFDEIDEINNKLSSLINKVIGKNDKHK